MKDYFLHDEEGKAIRECEDINEAKSLAGDWLRKYRDADEKLLTIKNAAVMMLAMIGGFIGGISARISGQSFVSALAQGLLYGAGIAFIGFWIYVLFGFVSGMIEEKESKTLVLTLKVLVCAGMLAIGALISFKLFR